MNTTTTKNGIYGKLEIHLFIWNLDLVSLFNFLYLPLCIYFFPSQMCAPFWPDARKPKEKYGPLEVILTNSESSNKTVAVQDFTVQHAGRKVHACRKT